MRTPVLALLPLFASTLLAQDVVFSPTAQQAVGYYAAEVPPRIGHCTDSLRIDTVYTENIATGELDMVVQTYPLARYEFYLDGAMYRRIDIKQVEDTQEVGWKPDLGTGDTIGVIQLVVQDLPNGAYHEFFPNGNIRIKGTLDGYNADGTLKKTGEWKEWDATGTVIRQETYP